MLFHAPPPVAFVDVAVLTMAAPSVLEHQTVVVKNGRVSWIGPANRARLPKAAQMVDGRGQYLLPGPRGPWRSDRPPAASWPGVVGTPKRNCGPG